MTAAAATFEEPRTRPVDLVLGFLRRNAWALCLVVVLGLMLAFTRFIQPTYGIAGIQGQAIGVLPLAFAAAAQAVIVIAGGIDLSVGSVMALTSVVAAVGMKSQTEEFGYVVVALVLLLGLVLGAINGALIIFTRVPDIIVTLAMSFVWAGCALLVLTTPGGGAAKWLTDLPLGSFANEWIPKAAVVLFTLVAVIWLLVRRSRLGLWFYAIGSSELGAFRSGVPVRRTKVLAYAVGGLFAALAGLSLTASTGNASPIPAPEHTLFSVAAVVLGGVSLAGGRGGLFGPIVAVFILSLLRTDLGFLKVNTSYATVAQGLILVAVVMLGTIVQFRRARK